MLVAHTETGLTLTAQSVEEIGLVLDRMSDIPKELRISTVSGSLGEAEKRKPQQERQL